MYILIEEREIFCDCHCYPKENIVVSDNFNDILKYCKEHYTMTEQEIHTLSKHHCVDDVYDEHRCSVNLIINVVL